MNPAAEHPSSLPTGILGFWSIPLSACDAPSSLCISWALKSCLQNHLYVAFHAARRAIAGRSIGVATRRNMTKIERSSVQPVTRSLADGKHLRRLLIADHCKSKTGFSVTRSGAICKRCMEWRSPLAWNSPVQDVEIRRFDAKRVHPVATAVVTEYSVR